MEKINVSECAALKGTYVMLIFCRRRGGGDMREYCAQFKDIVPFRATTCNPMTSTKNIELPLRQRGRGLNGEKRLLKCRMVTFHQLVRGCGSPALAFFLSTPWPNRRYLQRRSDVSYQGGVGCMIERKESIATTVDICHGAHLQKVLWIKRGRPT
jgi:hypothetical protein